MPVGLTKDAGWEIGVSRTLPVPLEAAWEFLTSPGGAALWLGAAAAPPLHLAWRLGARDAPAPGGGAVERASERRARNGHRCNRRSPNAPLRGTDSR
jgi:hypothetical protein